MSYNIENENTHSCYSSDEICPICGTYSPDGDVCVTCKQAHGLYKPKTTYSED